MEPPKRKYQKQKTEGRITIKHFLNTRLKGKKQDDGQNAYPLYVRIMVKGQLTDIKSRFAVLVVPENFEWFEQKNANLLAQEINSLIEIVKSLKPFDREGFILQQAVTIYSQSIKPLTTIIDESLKTEIRYCIVRNTSDLPTNADLTNRGQLELLSQDNDLIGLINWQQSAQSILDRLKSVISGSGLYDALLELEKTYYRAFNFDSQYNTLYAIHHYLAPPSLVDWRNGSLQKDMQNYFTNSSPTINTINMLLESHL